MFLKGKQCWFPALPTKRPPQKSIQEGDRDMEVQLPSGTKWGITHLSHASVVPPPTTGHINLNFLGKYRINPRLSSEAQKILFLVQLYTHVPTKDKITHP